MTFRGLSFGGRIRRDMAGIALSVPLIAYHSPAMLCWLWFIEWFRYRPESGCGHSFFRVVHLPGHQARTIIDLFWLGSLQFVWQAEGRTSPKRRASAASAMIVAVCFFFMASPAFAQVDVGGIFGEWRPYIVELVGLLAVAFVGVILELIRRWTGLSIEARHREALQTAVTNAAGILIVKAGEKLEGKTIDLKSPAVNEAVEYVLRGAPDAANRFGLTPQRIAEMIIAKLPQAGAAK